MSLCIAKLILAASFVQDQPKDSDVDCSKLRECRLVVTSSAPKLGGSALRQVPAFDQPWIQTCNHLVHVSVMVQLNSQLLGNCMKVSSLGFNP